MQPRSLLAIEAVAAVGEDLIERHEFHDLTVRQIGGLVEHEAAVPDAGVKGLHRPRLLFARS
jgi:hypothetical protein